MSKVFIKKDSKYYDDLLDQKDLIDSVKSITKYNIDKAQKAEDAYNKTLEEERIRHSKMSREDIINEKIKDYELYIEEGVITKSERKELEELYKERDSLNKKSSSLKNKSIEEPILTMKSDYDFEYKIPQFSKYPSLTKIEKDMEYTEEEIEEREEEDEYFNPYRYYAYIKEHMTPEDKKEKKYMDSMIKKYLHSGDLFTEFMELTEIEGPVAFKMFENWLEAGKPVMSKFIKQEKSKISKGPKPKKQIKREPSPEPQPKKQPQTPKKSVGRPAKGSQEAKDKMAVLRARKTQNKTEREPSPEPTPKKPIRITSNTKNAALEDGKYEAIRGEIDVIKDGREYRIKSKAGVNPALPQRVINRGVQELKDKIDKFEKILYIFKDDEGKKIKRWV